MSAAPDDIVESLYSGVFSAMALLAGMRLDLFTALAAGPVSTEQLAARLGVGARRLRPLLRSLARTRLIDRRDGIWSNGTTAERTLVRGRDGFVGDMHHIFADTWRSLLAAADSVRSGTAAASHDFAADGAVGADFFRGLHPSAVAAGKLFGATASFAHGETVADIGAGSGGFSIGLAGVVPGIGCLAVDLPTVTPVTRSFVAEAGLAGRIGVASHDLLAAPLETPVDGLVMRFFLQCLAPDDAALAVRHAALSVRPGGTVTIIGRVLDADDAGPWPAIDYGLIALTQYPSGDCHGEADYRAWLEAAGIVGVTRAEFAGRSTLLTGRRAAG